MLIVVKGLHWIYPSIGGALFGFGFSAMGDITFTMVIDIYYEVHCRQPFPFRVWLLTD